MKKLLVLLLVIAAIGPVSTVNGEESAVSCDCCADDFVWQALFLGTELCVKSNSCTKSLTSYVARPEGEGLPPESGLYYCERNGIIVQNPQ